MLRKVQVENMCWVWGHHRSFWEYQSLKWKGCKTKETHGGLAIVCRQKLHVYLYYGKSIVEVLDHALKSPSYVSKAKANGSTSIPSLVVKTMEWYVMPTLDSCVITIVSFDF